MYKKIMVSLDGSELAECVLPHVEDLARGSQVKKVVLVRVVEPIRPAMGGEYYISPEEMNRINSESKAAAESYLKQVASRLKYDGVSIEWKVLTGTVADTLADYGTKNEVDLIVISTHGRSGISRWIWGSVADRLLRSACVPVLMVRAPGCTPGI